MDATMTFLASRMIWLCKALWERCVETKEKGEWNLVEVMKGQCNEWFLILFDTIPNLPDGVTIDHNEVTITDGTNRWCFKLESVFSITAHLRYVNPCPMLSKARFGKDDNGLYANYPEPKTEKPVAKKKGQAKQNKKTTPKTNKIMEANNKKAADLIGKTIIVGEGIATIVIKSADGDKLQGEFKKAGTSVAMPLPVTMKNLEAQLEAGTWRIAESEAPGNPSNQKAQPTAKAQPRVQPKAAQEESEAPSNQKEIDEDDPVLKQWHEAKVQNPDAIIIFRNANIFVVVADDAEKLAKVAGLKTAQHNDTAICVFPNGDLSAVMMKAVGAGLRVKMEDLKQPQSDEAEVKAASKREQVKSEPRTENHEPKVRVQPKAAKEEESEAPSNQNNQKEPKPQPKHSEVTVEPEAGKPHIIKAGEKSVVVAGDTTKIEAVLLTLWGRKRPYTHKGVTYSGIQLSAKHKKTVDEIIKLVS